MTAPRLRAALVPLCAALLSACLVSTGTSEPDATQPPLGVLPRDVVPTAYTLELEIVPDGERFRGRTQIAVEVARATPRIWLHGRGLTVQAARVVQAERVHEARYRQVHATGVAVLELSDRLEPGPAHIEIEYDAPFSTLAGLYRVEAGGERYAFTQFEPLEARSAFPCFDEPAFKTPFDIWLTVPTADVAITNTPQVDFQPVPGGLKRLHYAPTKPLPTYLVAFAVGPFDVVEGAPIPASEVRAEPLPLRGIAARGQGGQLAYALEHTAPLLLELERYFGIAYPYAKLDLIAVPDFGAGAMENAAAITFREWLLLVDAKNAPEHQRRAFAQVMAHELAHHWFGNLVTMPWWDDIWLNEGFATWIGHRAVEAVHPEYGLNVSLVRSVHSVMRNDSRVSARKVRQPVPTNSDMGNAFDGITYQKGAGVLVMFERYLGEEVFRRGVQDYLNARPFGVGRSQDLVAALGAAAGRDLGGPFVSFLEQVGVPQLQVTPTCEQGQGALTLRQSRYLPLGSSARGQAEATRWKIPVCVRAGQADGSIEVRCTLLEEEQGTLVLEGGCPRWVMPNAAGAGYYRWALPQAGLQALQEQGYGQLSEPEKLSLADNLRAALASGDMDAAAVLGVLPRLASDPRREIATLPMGLLAFARERLLDGSRMPALEGFARELYAKRFERLGYGERAGDDGDTRLLRGSLASFLAEVARDVGARAGLQELGLTYLGAADGPLRPEFVAADLRRTALAVALQEGDDALFDRVLARFAESSDPAQRGDLLTALCSVHDAPRAARALSLTLDPRLKVAEVLQPLSIQMRDGRTREAAWVYLRANFDAIVERATPGRSGRLPSLGRVFCDVEHRAQLEAFFTERAPKLSGGPRNLAEALEAVTLCIAQRERQRESANAFFEAR